ncbi:MAG: tRNA (N6-isopentenyl adenosine(37)-C2)-methylthiotransferase MiaB [Armatimonadota bacterium]
MRYYIETFGCQMNVHDSETIAGTLAAMGWEAAPSPDQAELVLLNTCSVREKPHRKVFSRLGQLRLLKQQRPDMLIGVCGCMPQLIADEILKRAPYVDLMVGPREYASLPQAIAEAEAGLPALHLDPGRRIPENLPKQRADGLRAWVTAIYGCSNFCAYCVVPFARGPERSREPELILRELAELAERGFREVTLLGQNVNSYGLDLKRQVDFADLLAFANDVDSLERIRFTTSHPKDCSSRLMEAMAELPAVCEHLHLPVQSGDDQVLRRMNRSYTSAQYRELVRESRERIPEVSISTDVMVGFPGETDEAFERTLELFEEVRFDQAFMFKYNNRPATAASQMPDQVPEQVKQRRLERLIELQNDIAREGNSELVGQTVEVLVEGERPGHEGQLQGRTRTNKLVVFPHSPQLQGQLVPIRVVEGFAWGLKGELALSGE